MSLSLPDIEAQLDLHAARHRSRLDGLRALSAAEDELQAVLRAAMEKLSPPEPPVWWLSALARWGLVALEPPPVPVEEELWRHHEATLERVRALGHHLDTFRHDQDRIRQDVAEMKAHASTLAQARGALAAQRNAARARGEETLAFDAATVAMEAVEEKVQVMLSMHQAVQPAVAGMVGALGTLHDQGREATAALAAQITQLADELAAQTGAGVVRSIHAGLGELALAVDTSAVALSRDLDRLGERLRALDADARQRRAARAEVDAVG